MNHQGLRWNVHCAANVGLRIRLNLYKRGFKIYDLLVYQFLIRLFSLINENENNRCNTCAFFSTIAANLSI